MGIIPIGVLASGGGSNLQAILDSIATGELDARVVLVISNNSAAGALARARQAGVAWRHISGATHPGTGEEDRALAEALQAAGAEWICLAGYMKKIGPAMLNAYRGRILNIHPALLPRHGGPGCYGLQPHIQVLAAGDHETGATVHIVDEHYDHGPILDREVVPVIPGDTPETLQKRVLGQEHLLYPRVLRRIAAGQWPPIVSQEPMESL